MSCERRSNGIIFGAAGTALALLLAPAGARAAEPNPLLAAVGAPDDLTLTASVRSRGEYIAGQFRPATATEDAAWSLRTDILADYHPGIWRFGVEVRDSRAYGERHNSSVGTSEVDTLEPLQAYVGLDLRDLGGKGTESIVTAGRFTIDLGSGRLVGRPDYPNSVNSFTGASFDWRDRGGDRLFAFWSMPSTRLPSAADDIQDNKPEFDRARTGLQFYGADLTKTRLPGDVALEGYVFKLAEEDAPYQATKKRHLLTYGGRLFRKAQPGRFDFELEAVRQTGHEHATTAATDRVVLPVRAYYVHAEVGRKFQIAWSPRISVQGSLATGDDADPKRITRFDTLYGATRIDFGPSGLYGPLTRSNLRSLGLRFEATPSKRVDWFVMARSLWLDQPTDSFAATGVRDKTGRSGTYAGAQVEGRVRYWLVPRLLHTDIGGALLAKGRFLQDAPNAPATGSTRYLFVDVQVDL
ncbi:alginate export family protein [Sphingomonas nostoxanthinifaciens]|uniref:alginate export family protein n=1 Tax=Sphingomonas nostoxanthinifaciens TaxID=2872652 RepID=UPI001CC1D802|nr:alginate export family protein [Sphingomonas nostoxanthinifaciens]UAK26415.1 alginate export family protein [Sphingomonas nostoxanthinifaciens]